MDSKARNMIIAALIAFVAVLAVVPSDDVSAETADVQFSGYVDSSIGTLTGFTVTTGSEHTTVYLAIGDNSAVRAPSETGQPVRVWHVGLIGQLAEDTYDYTVYDENRSVIATGTVVVSAEPTYTISIADGIENGAVTSDVQKAAEGATVTLTVASSEHFALTEGSLKVTYGETEVELTAGEAVNTYTFSMPASDVTVSAAFEPVKYTITWNVDGTTTDVQVPYGTQPSYGTTDPVKDGYDFKGWSLTAGGDVLAEIPAATADATYYAVFEQKEAPVGDHKVTDATGVNGKTVSTPAAADEGVTVTIEVVPDSGYELDVLTVVDSAREPVATVKVDDTHYTFSMPASDVEVSATFKVSETPAPVDTGIAIDGVPYGTVKDALAKAESGDVIVISKAIPAEDVTLVDGVSISVTKDGSYTGTVTYDGSSVKFVKLGAGSVVAISGGSVDVSGNTFVGESEIQVAEGTMVLAGEIAKDATVNVTVASGASLSIGELTIDDGGSLIVTGDAGSVTTDDASAIAMQSGSYYYGPALTNANGSLTRNVMYSDGSKILYHNLLWVIYIEDKNGNDLRIAFSYLELEYNSQRAVNQSDVTKRGGSAIYGEVFSNDGISYQVQTSDRVLKDPADGDVYYNKTSETSVQDRQVAESIQAPGVYDYAVNFQFNVMPVGSSVPSLNDYADTGIIISPVDLGKVTGETSETFVYDGNAKELDLSKVVVKDGNGNVIALDLTGSEIDYADAHTDAGEHDAVIHFPGAGVYGAADIPVTFEITKAKVTITLTDNAENGTWTSGNYKDGNVTYALSEPKTDGALTATAVVTWKDGSAASTYTASIAEQADLDALLKGIYDGSDKVNLGYTISLTMTSAETDNFLAGVSNPLDGAAQPLVIEVGAFEKIDIELEFSSDDVTVKQDGTTVTVTGQLLKNTDGKFVFAIAAVSATDGVVLTDADGARGLAVVSQTAGVTAAVEDGVLTLAFELASLPAGNVTVQALAQTSPSADTVYNDSAVYTLDLSGIISGDFAIVLEETNYTTVVYTKNQIYDLTDNQTTILDQVENGHVYFYLPAPKAASYWTLTVNGEAKTTVVDGKDVDVSRYSSGSVYIVDLKDKTDSDGYIHFVATAGSSVDPEPEVQQAVTILATGYYADAEDAKNAINSAIKAIGLTTEISDVEKNTMFVIYHQAAAGTVTGTVSFVVDGETVTLTVGQYTRDGAGYAIFYWTSYEHEDGSENGYVEGFEKYVEGSQYTITVTDGDASAKVVSGNSGSTTGPSADYVTVTYVYGVDGQYTLKQLVVKGSALDTESFPYADVAGYTYTWSAAPETIDADTTITATYTPVDQPTVEYSKAIRAALDNNSGVYLMLVATDDGVIEDGKISVSYSYTTHRNYRGTDVTGSASGAFDQAYAPTDNKAYAYIAIDFTADATALSHYADITGASARFVASNDATASASSISFTLPSRS